MRFPHTNLKKSLLSVNRVLAFQILEELMGEQSATEIAEEIIVPSLEEIGKDWEDGRIALAQVYMSSRICEEWVERNFPLEPIDRDHIPVAIAVLEDYHLLGKRIVKAMLRSAGIPVSDYGTLSVQQLLAKALKDNIEVLLVSTLMLPSALRIKELTGLLQNKSPNTKVIVGGAPFRYDSQLWREVHAYAVGLNGADALRIVSELTTQRS